MSTLFTDSEAPGGGLEIVVATALTPPSCLISPILPCPQIQRNELTPVIPITVKYPRTRCEHINGVKLNTASEKGYTSFSSSKAKARRVELISTSSSPVSNTTSLSLTSHEDTAARSPRKVRFDDEIKIGYSYGWVEEEPKKTSEKPGKWKRMFENINKLFTKGRRRKAKKTEEDLNIFEFVQMFDTKGFSSNIPSETIMSEEMDEELWDDW